jgi:YcaO-like protein with predicted kinase domain
MTDLLDHEDELRSEFGITRIADVTRLYRYGYPVAISTVPRSRDDLSVYAGSGHTTRDARRRAIGEAIERQTAAAFDPPTVRKRADDLRTDLDIDVLTFIGEGDEDIPCVVGERVDAPGEMLLPVELVACPFFGKRRFEMISTNGLACGVDVEDATERAMLELVERHVESLYLIRSRYAATSRPRCAASQPVARALRWPSSDTALDEMNTLVEAAGDRLDIFFHDELGFPPYCFAVVTTRDGARAGGTACRLTSVAAAHAAAREAIQSVLVDAAATREDVAVHGEQHRPLSAQTPVHSRTPCDCERFDLGMLVRNDFARAELTRCVKPAWRVVLRAGDPGCVVRVISPVAETFGLDGRIRASGWLLAAELHAAELAKQE